MMLYIIIFLFENIHNFIYKFISIFYLIIIQKYNNIIKINLFIIILF